MNENENWREILSRIEGKLDQMESDVQKLSHKESPSLFKKFAGFIAHNFFTLLTLAALAMIAFKGLEFYENIISQIEAVKNIPTGALESLKDLPKGAGDSLNSIKDLIKSIKF